MQTLNVDVATEVLDGGGTSFSLGSNLLQRWLLCFLAASAQQVLRLTVEIILGLDLVTAVALCAPREVVVLALRANPAAVRKLKIAVCLWLFVIFKLVLQPLSRPHIVTLLHQNGLDLLSRPLTRLLGAILSRFGHEECSVKHETLACLMRLVRLEDRLDRWREGINDAASSSL